MPDRRAESKTGSHPEKGSSAVRIPVEYGEDGAVELSGDLTIPVGARGIVVFAHGTGSSRLSPRNRYVAEVLGRSRIATLLMDLLTAGEEAQERYTGHLRFNIPFLAGRLRSAIDWLARHAPTRGLSLGIFGASTGAAAALVAAANAPERVKAVVSRGGRPDLAGDALALVRCPTLLIVGGDDVPVIRMNQEALVKMGGNATLRIVPGATHLFEEPGTLEAVARLAADWFDKHLSG